MNENKENKDAAERIYNMIVIDKVREAENYLALYNNIEGRGYGKTKSLLKGYMVDLLGRLKSNCLKIEEFTLDQKCAKRKDKVIKEISDILI